MTTPTTNLLEWIDERIAELNKNYTGDDSYYMPIDVRSRLNTLNVVRARILQEVENEKAVIEKAYQDGSNNTDVYDPYNVDPLPNQYYQTTFNPNNDERR